ncbi:MAG: hypothetical protein RLP09_34580 [Sandaracinaceae bacterium]
MTEPNAEPSAPSIWLWPRLGPVRGVASLLGGGVALAALVAMLWGAPFWAWIEVGLLALALPLMCLDRVDAHAYVRAVLWGVFAVGAAGAAYRSEVVDLGLLLGTALCLLALGGKGFDAKHGSFTPRVLRRTLLTMMVTGLCVAHLLSLGALIGLSHSPWLTVALAASPALLIAGVLGLSRTRGWGLFAYLGAILLMVATAIAVGQADFGGRFARVGHLPSGRQLVVALWTVAAGLTALVGLPVMTALVFKRRPREEGGRPWGTWLHAAAVLGLVGLVLMANLR